MAQGVKTIDKDKFFDAYGKFVNGEISLSKASKLIGISKPTTSKYFGMAYLGLGFPDTLFESKKNKKKNNKKQSMTLKDAKDRFYPAYQYAVARSADNIPLWVCGTLEEAKEKNETSLENGITTHIVALKDV